MRNILRTIRNFLALIVQHKDMLCITPIFYFHASFPMLIAPRAQRTRIFLTTKQALAQSRSVLHLSQKQTQSAGCDQKAERRADDQIQRERKVGGVSLSQQ